MIISFNSTIFQTQDEEVQSNLAKILVILIENNHFIDNKSISSIFFDNEYKYIFDETDVSQRYLSMRDQQKLKDYITNNRKPITQLHRNYLTHFTIGTNLGEIHPNDAYKIINERSLVIIENYPNDWKFIRGIIYKYEHFGDRKSIYQLIKRALENSYLIYDHAGGSGIQQQIQGWVEGIYEKICRYKLMAIFDSDKKNPSDFKEGYKNLIKYLKNISIDFPLAEDDKIYEDRDRIVWHMLYKRAIENYVPVNVIKQNITNLSSEQIANLEQLDKTSEIMDFIVYQKPTYISIGKSKAKEQFPEMFLTNFLTSELENRCNHHKIKIKLPNGTIEEISELEQILLKIAKII